jgi:hypothetical protein
MKHDVRALFELELLIFLLDQIMDQNVARDWAFFAT